MKIHEFNLTDSENFVPLFNLVREVMGEFPEFQNMYDDVAIALAYSEKYDEVSNQMLRFINPTINESARAIFKPEPAIAESDSYERGGYIIIFVDNFVPYPKQFHKDLIRHECCHLSLRHSSNALMRKLFKYTNRPFDILWFLHTVGKFYFEFEAYQCMFNRFKFFNFHGPPKTILEGPRKYYRGVKKSSGKMRAFLEGVKWSVLLLSQICLWNCLINQIGRRSEYEEEISRLETHLNSFLKCMKKDFRIQVEKWLNPEIYESEDIFINRIMELLNLIDSESQIPKVFRRNEFYGR